MPWSKTYYDNVWTRIFQRGGNFEKICRDIKIQKSCPEAQNLALGEGRSITAGVLFVDIVSFTERSRYETPSQLLLILDVFLSEMTSIVNDWGGTIEKYTGDGLMAIFDTSQTTTAGMSKTVIDVATTMKYCIEGPINAFLHTKKIEPIKFRIGIDGGQITVGRLGIKGDNDPVAIGFACNIAAKLQEISDVNGILLGSYIYSNLPDFEKNYCELHFIPENWTYIKLGTAEKYPFYKYNAHWITPPNS